MYRCKIKVINMMQFDSGPLVRQECIFKNSDPNVKCTPNNDLNLLIMCKNHANIFNLIVTRETLLSSNQTLIVFDSLKYTGTPRYFLPFPFDWMSNENEFCIDKNALSSMTTKFGVESNLKLTPYLNDLVALYSTGAYHSQNVYSSVNHMLIKFLQDIRFTETVKNRWNGVQVKVQKGGQLIDIPMTKLPLFFQIIFYYANVSNTCIVEEAGTSTEKVTAMLAISPNLVFNIDKKQIEIINNSSDRQLFIYSDESTYSTSVTLLAQTTSTSAFAQHAIFTNASNKILRLPLTC